ncbi:hypothetical protein CHUAL_013055 [Chamberlinius hualienensis]
MKYKLMFCFLVKVLSITTYAQQYQSTDDYVPDKDPQFPQTSTYYSTSISPTKDVETRPNTDRQVDVSRHNGLCGHPDNKANSQTNVTKPWVPTGTIASYTCDPGFYILGNDLRKCETNGTWSESAPTCARKVSVGKIMNCSASEYVNQNDLIYLVDGKDTTCAKVQRNPQISVHQPEQEVTLIWRMDLLEEYTAVASFRLVYKGNALLSKVTLESRFRATHELVPTECVITSKDINLHFKEMTITPNRPQPARYVNFHIKLRMLNNPLEFCEAEIYDVNAPAVHQCYNQNQMDSFLIRSNLADTTVKGHTCYTFDNNKDHIADWKNANHICAAINDGSLIHDVTADVNQLITNYLKASYKSNNFWMGGRVEKKHVPDAPNGESLEWSWLNGNQIDKTLINTKGVNENECLALSSQNGVWINLSCQSYIGVICQTEIKRCASPAINVRAIATEPLNTSIGAIIEYRCPDGFVMVGSERQHCKSDGQWSGQSPECLSKDGYAAYQDKQTKLPEEAIIGIIIAAVIVGIVMIAVIIGVLVARKRGGRFKKTIHFNKKDGESVECLDDKNDTIQLNKDHKENYSTVNQGEEVCEQKTTSP